MIRKWWSIIVEFVLAVCFFVYSLAVSFLMMMMFLSVCFYLFLSGFFYIYVFTLRVFLFGLISVLAGVALSSAVLSFVSCGSGGGIDVITNTFLAQSFLTSILRVGVCVIAYGFVERADRK